MKIICFDIGATKILKSVVKLQGRKFYFLEIEEEKNPRKEGKIKNIIRGKESCSERSLDEFKTFIRFSQAVSIVRKLKAISEPCLTELISATRPFGLQTSDRPDQSTDLILVSSGGTGGVATERVTSGHSMIDKWKVMTSKTSASSPPT